MLNLLIAVDGSEHANRAIEAVAKMAHSALDLQVTLVCVSPEPLFYGDYTVGTIEKIEEDQKRQQNNILLHAMALGRTHGLQLSDPVRAYGVVANEIVRIAKERAVDQIVLGTRGMGAVGNLLLGSVAQRVLHQSLVPVLLVK